MNNRKAITPRADQRVRGNATFELEAIGDKNCRLDLVWPITSELKNERFKQEMNICAIHYNLNASGEICGL